MPFFCFFSVLMVYLGKEIIVRKIMVMERECLIHHSISMLVQSAMCIAPWPERHEDDVGCSAVPHGHLNLLLGPVRTRNCDLLKTFIINLYCLTFTHCRVDGHDDHKDEKETTLVFDVMASMEHMKMSATMKTATKLK